MLLEEHLYNQNKLYVGRHCRYASVGGQTELPNEFLQSIKRTYSEKSKDPLKRFEFLRNGKATSVMIRATPNAVRWDEINRVQYRFQALNFHSDVLEALIQNSPPLSRREHKAATKDESLNGNDSRKQSSLHDDNNNEIGEQNDSQSNDESVDSLLDGEDNKTLNGFRKDKRGSSGSPHNSRFVTCIHRTNSFESIRQDFDDHYGKRKGSVVQLTKDDTSDYNSDEDVFPNRSESDSLDSVTFNTTICHVNTGHIQDTARIQVTSHNVKDENDGDTEDIEELSEQNENKLLEVPSNDNNNNNNKPSLKESLSEPISSTASICSIASDEISTENRLKISSNDAEGDDLNMKSKEELVALVMSLQKELETKNHLSLQKGSLSTRNKVGSPNSTRRRSRSALPLYKKRPSSREDSISEEEVMRSPRSVHRLIENFELKTDTSNTMKRSNTVSEMTKTER